MARDRRDDWGRCRSYRIVRELVDIPVSDLWDVAEQKPVMRVVRWVVYGHPMVPGGPWPRMAECTSEREAEERVAGWQRRQLALMG